MADKIGQTITLSPVEQRICRGIAKMRYFNARSAGVKNAKIGGQSDAETDLEGFGAEMAFCRMFNVFPDLTIEIRCADTDKGDAVLPCGSTVDVKSTKYESGKLLASPSRKSGHDLYALMTGEFPTYTFRGFMKTSELHQDTRLGECGWNITYMAKQDELQGLSMVVNGPEPTENKSKNKGRRQPSTKGLSGPSPKTAEGLSGPYRSSDVLGIFSGSIDVWDMSDDP